MWSVLCRDSSACRGFFVTKALLRGFLVTKHRFLTGCVFEAENSLTTCTQSCCFLSQLDFQSCVGKVPHFFVLNKCAFGSSFPNLTEERLGK